jgi:type VI secretion system ImpA family protein
MTGAGWNVEAWSQPIAPEQPCGENLEDQLPLVALDALRLFGQSRPIDTDDTRKPVDWAEVRSLALEGLVRSHDLRLLGYLGTAALRTDGLAAFFDTLITASRWLETFWVEVYPQIDEDAIARRNALNCLADPMAVLDRLRRAVVVESRQHGRFSLRDIDIAKGNLQPGPSEGRPELAQIEAAFAEMPLEALTGLRDGTESALEAVTRIDAKMRDDGDAGVSFEALSQQLARLRLVVPQGRRRRPAPSGRGRTPRGRSRPWPSTSAGTSRRARCRCCWTGPSGWSRRPSSRCSRRWRPTGCQGRGPPAGCGRVVSR